MTYEALLHPHLLLIAISGGVFGLRFLGGVLGMSLLQGSLIRLVHLLANLGLLVTGLALGHVMGLYPLINSGWITASFVAFIGYMLFSALSLEKGWFPGLIVAVVCFVYAAWAAMSKQVLPFF